MDVKATIKPALLADACGCTANELAQQVKIIVPGPVPTVGDAALVALSGLMLLLALRGGIGQRGMRALAMLGVGVALIQPTQEPHAAVGDALESMTVSTVGKTVTVTVKRNAQCKVNLAPVLPASPINFWINFPRGPNSAVLPPALDPENDLLRKH